MEHALSYLLHSCLIVSYPLFSSAILSQPALISDPVPSSLMLFCAVLCCAVRFLSCTVRTISSYRIMSYPALSCPILSCLSYPVLSCTSLSCFILSCLSYLILSCPILSYPVLSSCPASPILSYPAYPALFCVISD